MLKPARLVKHISTKNTIPYLNQLKIHLRFSEMSGSLFQLGKMNKRFESPFVSWLIFLNVYILLKSGALFQGSRKTDTGCWASKCQSVSTSISHNTQTSSVETVLFRSIASCRTAPGQCQSLDEIQNLQLAPMALPISFRIKHLKASIMLAANYLTSRNISIFNIVISES